MSDLKALCEAWQLAEKRYANTPKWDSRRRMAHLERISARAAFDSASRVAYAAGELVTLTPDTTEVE